MVDLEKIPAVGGSVENPRHSMTWTEYHTLDDMYSYLDYLEQTFDFVSTEIVGQSGEGRDMRVARVCKGGCGGKKAVWIGAVLCTVGQVFLFIIIIIVRRRYPRQRVGLASHSDLDVEGAGGERCRPLRPD